MKFLLVSRSCSTFSIAVLVLSCSCFLSTATTLNIKNMFAGGINGALGGVADQSAGQKGGCTQAELTRLGEVAGEIVDLAEAAITLIDRLLDLSNPVYQSEALTATKLLGVNMYEYRTGEVGVVLVPKPYWRKNTIQNVSLLLNTRAMLLELTGR